MDKLFLVFIAFSSFVFMLVCIHFIIVGQFVDFNIMSAIFQGFACIYFLWKLKNAY